MPITLAQAQNLSQSKLVQTVIDEFRKSALLDQMIWDNTAKATGGTSLSYTYNRVTTLPTAAPRAINTEYTPQEPATTPVTVMLKIFGGSYQIDRALEQNEEQVMDLVEFLQSQKIQAATALFHDMFINGDSGTNASEFDGLDKLITGSGTDYTPAEVIDLSTSAAMDANWKKYTDALRALRARMDGAPTLYLMNSEMFARHQAVMDRAGINLTSKENYGDEVLQWGRSLIMSLGDKPGTSNPIIGVDEGATDIFAVRLGLDGVHGVSPDGTGIIHTYLPNFTSSGAVKTGEVEMIAAMALKATRAAGVVRGIKIA
ncbi:MAG: major capsid protein [Aristaeellaceae bacterium]